jgi:hypothetical protein
VNAESSPPFHYPHKQTDTQTHTPTTHTHTQEQTHLHLHTHTPTTYTHLLILPTHPPTHTPHNNLFIIPDPRALYGSNRNSRPQSAAVKASNRAAVQSPRRARRHRVPLAVGSSAEGGSRPRGTVGCSRVLTSGVVACSDWCDRRIETPAPPRPTAWHGIVAQRRSPLRGTRHGDRPASGDRWNTAPSR